MKKLPAGKWEMDSAHSEIGMSIRHAGIARVSAEFKEVNSTLEVMEDANTKNSTYQLEVSIDAQSFSSNSEDRDVHVRGEDFLDADNFPHITFYGSGQVPEGVSAMLFDIEGEMTIKGITKTVVFEVEYGGYAVDPFGSSRAGFTASAAISRREFGITWNAALETGGFLVGDKVAIELDVSYVLK